MTSRIDSKALSNFTTTPIDDFRPRPCTNRALIGSLHHVRAHFLPTRRGHFAGPAIEGAQSFVLHLQLHLRILLEDLRVSLAKHLCHPLVRYASGTEPLRLLSREGGELHVRRTHATDREASHNHHRGFHQS